MADRAALIYQQNSEEFRSLNGFFWQIPLIMMTLNGGLWYSVASLELGLSAQRGVLAFGALANLVMVVGLWRLRSVMKDLLTHIHAYQGTTAPGRPRLIQILFSLMLVAAAAGSLLASIDPRANFTHRATHSAEPAPTSQLPTCQQTDLAKPANKAKG